MTDDATPYDDWARQWLDGQQQAWQAWLGGQVANPPGTDPAAALAGWLDGDATGLGGEVGERLLAQGQQFLQLATALGESLAERARAGDETDWQAVFDDTVARVRATLAPDADGEAHPAGALDGLLHEWQKVGVRLGVPRMPAQQVGVGTAGAAYLAAAQAYGARLAAIQRDALDRLQRELNDQHAAGGAITSLRALYDLWVEASEAAYAEQVATPAFVAVQAELAHALARLRQAAAPERDTDG